MCWYGTQAVSAYDAVCCLDRTLAIVSAFAPKYLSADGACLATCAMTVYLIVRPAMIQPSNWVVDMPASLAMAMSGCRITGREEMNTAPNAPNSLSLKTSRIFRPILV